MPTTFILPDYTIGNSADCQTQSIGVLQGLDQALQSLQPAPNATTVKFNNTVRCDAGGSTRTDMSNTIITQTETAVGTIPYMPTFILPAVSNQTIQIPPFTANPHQIICQSAPVPTIDTLEVQPWTLPSGETINTFSSDSGSIFIGCESGNVYYFNNAGGTWDLQATFDDAVRCIYYEANGSRLYIGGKFNSMLTPAPIGSLNKVCYIGSGLPSLANVSVDIWANYSVNGFDDAVNAIVGNNDMLYFGGRFQNNSNSSLNCKYIAAYDWATTGNLYALDNVSGCGFDSQVWSLAIDTNTYLCVAGDFQNVIESTGTFPANYCCQLTISGTTFTVVQLDFLYGIPTALTNPISKTEAVQTNTSTDFYISTNDSNIAGNGLNYFIGTGFGNSFPTTFQIGNNSAVVQQQFTYQPTQSGNFSIGTNDVYLVNNTIIATLTFSNAYVYWNYHYARAEFYDPATGSIYAFTGDLTNTFTLQGGRTIENSGTTYTGGITLGQSGTGYGFGEVLVWNGTYYSPTWILGGTPF